MSSTNKMEIQLAANGEHKRCEADLDTRLGPSQWERLYLEEGFQDTQTGKLYLPAEIVSISVSPVRNVSIPVQSSSMQWLSQQVEEVRRVGATL